MAQDNCAACQYSETSCLRLSDRIRLLDRQGKIVWTDHNIQPLTASAIVGSYIWEIVVEPEELTMKRIVRRVLEEAKPAEFVRQDRFIQAWWHIKLQPAMTAGSEIGAVLTTRKICVRLFELSQSQRIILEKLVRGHTVERIARRLHITVNTVRTQIARAKTKLLLNSTAELLIWCQHHRDLLIHDLSRLQRQGSDSWVPDCA